MRNKYTSVIVDGRLLGWTGPNPDKDPKSKERALRISQIQKGLGKTSYPVVVEEILETDLPKEPEDAGLAV